jgi:hypothetical protein
MIDSKPNQIEDKKLLGSLVKSLFPNLPISMVYKGEEIPLRVICLEPDFVLIRSTGRTDQEDRILTFTNNGSLYHFYFRYTEKSTSDIEYLEPLKLVIHKHSLRKQVRTPSSILDSNTYVTNFVKESTLQEKIQENCLWKQTLDESISFLREKFSEVNFHFSDRKDLRFQAIEYTNKSIFFPRKDWIPFNSTVSEIKELRNIMPNEDWNIVKGPQIVVPLFYRSKKILGYVSVQNESEMELGDFTLVNLICATIQKSINQIQEIILTSEQCSVLDISLGGVGFLIKQENLFPEFETGQEFILELFIGGVSAIFSIIVRNVNILEGKGKRVGAEFKDNGEEEIIFLKSFYHSV